MAYVRFDQLAQAQLPLRKTASQVLNETRAAPSANVFLSHSHLDQEGAAHAVILLEQHGATVRVDIREPALYGATGTDAAPVVRAAIFACPKLVVAVTKNIGTSRWIPWELGLADGKHGHQKAALLPLVQRDNDPAPVEVEYLGLYPTIEWVKLQNQPAPRYCVRDPASGNYWTLQQWLSL